MIEINIDLKPEKSTHHIITSFLLFEHFIRENFKALLTTSDLQSTVI